MTPATQPFFEEVEIQGHIIDSRSSCRRCVLDEILTQGGTYVIKDIRIGQRQEVSQLRPHRGACWQRPACCGSQLNSIHDHGAVSISTADCHTVEAEDMDGAFPRSSAARQTLPHAGVRLGGEWIDVEDQEMDCGILVDRRAKLGPLHRHDRRARRATASWSAGRVRVFPAETQARQNLFEFMASPVSSEKPSGGHGPRDRSRDEANQGVRRKDPRRAGPGSGPYGQAPEHIVALASTWAISTSFSPVTPWGHTTSS